MSAPLIDTSILVDVLRKKPRAEASILDTAANGLVTHDTVIGELLMGIRNKDELQALDELLIPFETLHPSDLDSAFSLQLLRRYRLSHSTGYLDCLIAATALRLNLPIATLNDKHFRPFPIFKSSDPINRLIAIHGDTCPECGTMIPEKSAKINQPNTRSRE